MSVLENFVEQKCYYYLFSEDRKICGLSYV